MKNFLTTLCLLATVSLSANDCVPLTFARISNEYFPLGKPISVKMWAKEFKTDASGTSFSTIKSAVAKLRPDFELKTAFTVAWDGTEVDGYLELRKFATSLVQDTEEEFACGVAYVWFGFLPPDIIKKYAVDPSAVGPHCCILSFRATGNFILYLQSRNGNNAEVEVDGSEFTKRTILLLSLTSSAPTVK